MQLRPRNKLVSIPSDNIYRDTSRKGDRPRQWSYRKQKPAGVKQVNVNDYIKEQAHE